MASGRLAVDGCDLYFEEEGSGRPVVMIHGAGAYAGLYQPCVAELESSFRVVTYDRRGLSRSIHPPVRKLRVHVEDAAHLIRCRFGEPVTILGWSAGAMIALHLAIEHPDTVASLVLAEPPLQLQAPRPTALGALLRWELKRLMHGSAAGAEVFYRWVSQYRGASGNAFDSYPDEWRQQMLDNADALFSEIAIGGGALGEGIRRAALARIDTPIEILLGSRSAPIFEPASRYLARVCRQAVLTMVPDASHMVPTDRPDVVADAVRRATSG